MTLPCYVRAKLLPQSRRMSRFGVVIGMHPSHSAISTGMFQNFSSTRQSPVLSQTYLDDPKVRQKIDFTKPILLVTHGWLDNHNLIWLQQIAQDAQHFLDTNVCIVGWDQLAKYNYFQAAKQNCRLVSDYLTRFVNFLTQEGMSLDIITLAGHSLGAHICGQVGNNLNGQIAEIYGIDPAGPLFTFPVDVGKQNRLDKSDAKYVQMILTTRYTLGVGSGDGHENFYPNGGTSPQPNCVFPVSSDAEMADQIICSHLHSASLFRFSLDPSNAFKGRRCTNWVNYLLGSCMFNARDSLGVYSQKLGGDFYLKTSAVSPYVNKF